MIHLRRMRLPAPAIVVVGRDGRHGEGHIRCQSKNRWDPPHEGVGSTRYSLYTCDYVTILREKGLSRSGLTQHPGITPVSQVKKQHSLKWVVRLSNVEFSRRGRSLMEEVSCAGTVLGLTAALPFSTLNRCTIRCAAGKTDYSLPYPNFSHAENKKTSIKRYP